MTRCSQRSHHDKQRDGWGEGHGNVALDRPTPPEEMYTLCRPSIGKNRSSKSFQNELAFKAINDFIHSFSGPRHLWRPGGGVL